MRGFPGGSVVRNPPADAGDTVSVPGPGRSHRGALKPCFTTIDPSGLGSLGTTTTEAYEPQSPCCATRKATAMKSACLPH